MKNISKGISKRYAYNLTHNHRHFIKIMYLNTLFFKPFIYFNYFIFFENFFNHCEKKHFVQLKFLVISKKNDILQKNSSNSQT